MSALSKVHQEALLTWTLASPTTLKVSEATMDAQQPNLEARLRAIEFLIANLYGIENRRRGWDADRIFQEHRELLDRMRQSMQARGSAHDPAPHEVYRAVEHLLSDIRALS